MKLNETPRCKTIGVVGLWHLGCVLCASWSMLGNRVIGFDYDTSRVDSLSKGVPPLYEPGLEQSLKEGLAKGYLRFSSAIAELQECDFVFISYDTPVLDDDSSDVSILEKAISDVGPVMKEGAVVIVSSQSPVGLCRLLRTSLKTKNPSLDLAYSPENLRLGEAIQCYLTPGRIILGVPDARTEQKCKDLFSAIKAEILTMSLESGEMVKHGINSFLSASIVFANQLADICEGVGARIDDVIRGMKTDPRIGPRAYLSPGIGFSGGTLGRDLKVLARRNEEAAGKAGIFELIHAMNDERKNAIVRRIEVILGEVEAKRIAILGLTYKPGTSTLRRSLPLEIVKILQNKKADVTVFDPKADYNELGRSPSFRVASTIEEAAHSADALVLLTEWNEFKTFNWRGIPGQMKRPVFFDTKNFLDQSEMSGYGFNYYGVGRS